MYHLIYEVSKFVGDYYHNVTNPLSIKPIEALYSLQRKLISLEKNTPVRELLMGVETALLELVN